MSGGLRTAAASSQISTVIDTVGRRLADKAAIFVKTLRGLACKDGRTERPEADGAAI